MGKDETFATGNRFRQIADQLYDGNKSELARSLNMQPSSFSKYVQGSRHPGAQVLTRISQLGVNINWFLTGKGPMMRSGPDPSNQPLPLKSNEDMAASIESPDGSLRRIPVVRVRANESGDPILEEIGAAEWMSESYIRQTYGIPPEELKGFRCPGNAMAETIRPGEHLRGALWNGESLIDGGVYLVYAPAGVMLRRLYIKNDTIRLVADCPDVPDQTVGTERWPGAFRPIARMLEVVRSL